MNPLRVVQDVAASADGPRATPDETDLPALLVARLVSPASRRSYAADLSDLAGHLSGGAETRLSPEAALAFVSQPQTFLIRDLEQYRAGMIESGLAPASINRRLSTVRSLLSLANRLGLAPVDGRGLIEGVKVQTYRDTRGVSVATMRRLLDLPAKLHPGEHGQASVHALRDEAILRLLCELGLRRAEVCSLNVRDFEPGEKRIWIRGKGRANQAESLTISPKAVSALKVYLKAAGHKDARGPLFRNLCHRPADRGRRLSGTALYDIVHGYGERLGLTTLGPHKIRHSAITAVVRDLKQHGGDLREAQKFSRHRDIRTLLIYDDRIDDAQGRLTRALSKQL